MEQLRNYFTPPTFDDEEKTLTSRLLYTIFALVIGVTLVLTFPLALLVPSGGGSIAAQGGVGILICLFLYFFVRRGMVRTAAHLLVWLFWVLNTVTVITSGGIEANAFSNYMVIIFTSGLLLGARTGLAMTLMCTLVGVGVVIAESNGTLPPSYIEQSPYTLLFSNAILFFLVVLLQGIAARMIQQALHRARASEEQYRALLESTPAITYINSLEKGNPTTYVSPQVKQVLGHSQKEFLDDPLLWVSLIHPDDQAMVENENERTNSTGESFVMDYRVFNRDGEVVWLHDEAVLVKNIQGDPQYWLGVWTDITERKQTETALTSERDFLRALMDNIPDLIYFKDTELHFTRVNATHARHLGVNTPEEAIGKTDLDFQPSSLAESFLKEEQEMMRTGQPVIDRLEFNPTSDGKPRWFSATKVLLRDRVGRINGIVGISRDVTERELTRQMLEKQATELVTVAGVSTAITTILDVSELLQTVVTLTQESFKLYHAQVYLLADDIKHLIVAAGTGKAGEKMQTEGWNISLDHPHSIVARVARTLEGALFNDVQTVQEFLPNPFLPDTRAELAVPITIGQHLLGVFDLQSDLVGRFTEEDVLVYTALAQQLAVALQNARRYELAQVEIIERKRAEEALQANEHLFRAAIEAAGAVPYSIQYNEARYTFMGEGIYKLIGIKAEAMTTEIWSHLIEESIMLGEGSGLTRFQATQKAIAGDLTIWQADYRIRTLDGSVRWISDASVQLAGDGGVNIGAIGILQDITARKQIEEELQKLNLELEKRVEERTSQLEVANQELEAFSYAVSHDLRVPVRAMAGFSAILMEDYAHQIPVEAQSQLQYIHAGAERMGQLVDGLLTFTRLGRQTITRQPLDLTAIVRQVLEELGKLQFEREITITIEELPPGNGDPALLKQVFSQLLDNAFKYTEDEPNAQIHIGFNEENEELVYFIRDNGMGFDMQYAHKLFGVFQQLHLPGEYEGTGIGLALVRRIIEKHGGRIWAIAEPGMGATFFFTLE